jgi:sulfite reductase (NADPH) flavoprotein alpha-component
MAKDVENTLTTIIEKEGKCSHQAAREYIKEMRHSKRYLADVY